jgi:hypothetical protein
VVTAWCLAVAFLAPWVVGAPLRWLVGGCRPLRPGDWLWVPLAGLAGIVLPLQNLAVWADLPLARTVPWFWCAVAAGWGAMLGSRAGRASLRRVPWRVLALALAVYLSAGVGVLAQGVERYRGNMLSDQYHYVVLAQFLADEPFSTDWPDVGQRPWLVMPVALKDDRLGQSVIQAFLAVSAGREALDLFFPTQLLGVGLLCPAVLLLGRQLGLSRRASAWAAAASGLAPGVLFLQSNCYLSHALCLPALVAFLAAVVRLARGGGWRPLPDAMTALGLGFAVYTEFAPLFLGAGAAALALGKLAGHVGAGRVLGVTAALALALCANPAAVAGAVSVCGRGAGHGAGMSLQYPLPVWVAGVWLHQEKAVRVGHRLAATPAHALAFGGFAAAALGAGWSARRALRGGRRRLPALACCSLAVPPLLVWLVRPESVYVISKLLWTLTPVLVLFVAFALQAAGERLRAARWRPIRAVAPAAAGVLLVTLGIQSLLEQRSVARGWDEHGPSRVWNDPDLRQLCGVVRRQPSADVVVALRGDGGETTPSAASGALCYHARRHRFRLADPRRVWMVELREIPAGQLTPSAVPAGALVVRRRESRPLPVGAAEVVFANRTYELVRLAGPCEWGR